MIVSAKGQTLINKSLIRSWMSDIALRIFETPELTMDLRPGYVIEALPGALVTHTRMGYGRIYEAPTGVIGCVRGALTEDRIFAFSRMGETLVERLIPYGAPHMSDEYDTNTSHRNWCTKKDKRCLVIGELVQIPSIGYTDEFSRSLSSGSLTLPPVYVDSLRKQLLAYVQEHGEKELLPRATKAARI
jgi:hypothetical protein